MSLKKHSETPTRVNSHCRSFASEWSGGNTATMNTTTAYSVEERSIASDRDPIETERLNHSTSSSISSIQVFEVDAKRREEEDVVVVGHHPEEEEEEYYKIGSGRCREDTTEEPNDFLTRLLQQNREEVTHEANRREDNPHKEKMQTVLMIEANVYYRENTLTKCLDHWRRLLEDRVARRKYQETFAVSFHDTRMRYLLFRAWQWRYQRRKNVALLREKAEHFWRTQVALPRFFHCWKDLTMEKQRLQLHSLKLRYRYERGVFTTFFAKWLHLVKEKKKAKTLSSINEERQRAHYFLRWKTQFFATKRNRLLTSVIELHTEHRWWNRSQEEEENNNNSGAVVEYNGSVREEKYVSEVIKEFGRRDVWRKWLLFTFEKKKNTLHRQETTLQFLMEKNNQSVRRCFFLRWASHTQCRLLLEGKTIPTLFHRYFIQKWGTHHRQCQRAKLFFSTVVMRRQKLEVFSLWRHRQEKRVQQRTDEKKGEVFFQTRTRLLFYQKVCWRVWKERFCASQRQRKLVESAVQNRVELLQYLAVRRGIDYTLGFTPQRTIEDTPVVETNHHHHHRSSSVEKQEPPVVWNEKEERNDKGSSQKDGMNAPTEKDTTVETEAKQDSSTISTEVLNNEELSIENRRIDAGCQTDISTPTATVVPDAMLNRMADELVSSTHSEDKQLVPVAPSHSPSYTSSDIEHLSWNRIEALLCTLLSFTFLFFMVYSDVKGKNRMEITTEERTVSYDGVINDNKKRDDEEKNRVKSILEEIEGEKKKKGNDVGCSPIQPFLTEEPLEKKESTSDAVLASVQIEDVKDSRNYPLKGEEEEESEEDNEEDLEYLFRCCRTPHGGDHTAKEALKERGRHLLQRFLSKKARMMGEEQELFFLHQELQQLLRKKSGNPTIDQRIKELQHRKDVLLRRKCNFQKTRYHLERFTSLLETYLTS